jgi:DNA processing protein
MPIASAHLDWLAIRLAPEMTRPRFYNLMARFATPEAVFAASAAEIARVRGFDSEIARSVFASMNNDEVQRHADRLAAGGIHIVTRDDEEYPVNLAQSSLAPPLLFVKGTLAPEDKYSIAMVGSRHATQYGRAVSSEFAAGLARYGMTVISGFARGVDGEAHNAALKAGGRTIAVLGNGLDICYPSEHRGLVEKVAANGALITEYPLGTPPDRFNFPERNHVIAALSLGTIVAEAAEKSGSLITARLAVEENRFIFAVPGDITRNNSRGANGLIQQGARMVQRPQDVLIEMKEILRGYLNEDMLTQETAEPEEVKPARKRTSRELKPAGSSNGTNDGAVEEGDVVAVAAKPQARVASAGPVLTEEETFIVEILRHEATVFDELAAQAFGRGIDTPRLTSILMKLELRQVIRQLPGRYFVLFQMK